MTIRSVEPGPSTPENPSRTLDQLRPGERARVQRVRGSGAIHHRILDMGISRGTIIEVERAAPLRDPLKIKVRGYALSLRRCEAALIDLAESIVPAGDPALVSPEPTAWTA